MNNILGAYGNIVVKIKKTWRRKLIEIAREYMEP